MTPIGRGLTALALLLGAPIVVANMDVRSPPRSAPEKIAPPAATSARDLLNKNQPGVAASDLERDAENAAADLIRAWGYKCYTVDVVLPDLAKLTRDYESWAVSCNHYEKYFTIENNGRGLSGWSVKPS